MGIVKSMSKITEFINAELDETIRTARKMFNYSAKMIRRMSNDSQASDKDLNTRDGALEKIRRIMEVLDS